LSRAGADQRVPTGRRLALIPAGASPHEVAAIVAALEQFARDTARATVADAPAEPDGWLLAARHEATAREREDLVRDPWINT